MSPYELPVTVSRYESLFEAGVSTATPLLITQTTEIASQLIGLAVLAGTLAALAGMTYRWYTRETLPTMLALLVGLSGVALYLNTTTALGQAVVGDLELGQDFQLALYHLAAFISGGAGALGGRRVGNRFGADVLLRETTAAVDAEVSRLVQTVGRVIVVELPEEIDDVVGYDPVPAVTKKNLAGKRFVFPQNLTVEELHTRLVARLRTDYAVGHADIELAEDGTVEYLALGSRAAGIGPTLPPATNAVAIRADPAFAASSGDIVQVWETEPMRRIATAELRGVAEDIVTIAIGSADTPKLDPTREYRLVTLSVDDRPAREFASLLRTADETFSSVTVEAGSPLHGVPVGALELSVIAIKPESGQQVIHPDDQYVLAPGETVFAIARPEELRRLKTAARPLESSPVGAMGRSTDLVDSPPTENWEGRDATDSDPATSPKEVGTSTADGSPEPASGVPDDGSRETAETSAGVDDTSFEKLKADFEAVETDWAADDSAADAQSDESGDPDAGQNGRTTPEKSQAFDGSTLNSSDDVVPLEDADLSFGDEKGSADVSAGDGEGSTDVSAGDGDDTETNSTSGDEEDAVLSELGFEDDVDDSLGFEDEELSNLGFEGDDDGEALSFGDGSETDTSTSGEETESENEETGEESDDSGGTSTFAQLKEEFESGDADWADDLSDDPGGDMRLDE